MPMQRHLYPEDWKRIAFDVKENANWECQHYGKVCRKTGENLADFCKRIGEDHLEKPQRFTLTVAHLDHDPQNPSARLAALCSVCHLRYDAVSRRRKRVANINQSQ